MTIHGSSEDTVPVETDNVFVRSDVAARLPDAGAFLLTMLSFLSDSAVRAAEVAINRLRHPNGAIPGQRLRELGMRDWKLGPTAHLSTLTADDHILVEVWASSGLGRRDRQRIGKDAVEVYLTQGLPAAATWAIHSRPNSGLPVGTLAERLTQNWTDIAGRIHNDDIIKSFKKWRYSQD